MDTQAVINEINLLKAHASEALKIADRLTTALNPDRVTRQSQKKRMMDEQVARIIAKKNKKRQHYSYQ